MTTFQVREKNVSILGKIAEKMVANELSKNGPIVTNPDEYGFWDIQHSGRFIQVKTSTPFVKFNAWAFSEHAIDGIMKCDDLYILSMPVKKPYNHHLDGWILKIPVDKLSYRNIEVLSGSFNKDNKKSLVIKRTADYIEKFYKLTPEEEANVLKHAITYINK